VPVLQSQLQASFVLLIGTVGWALSGLRRGREATRLTAAGYTAALQEAAAADAAAVVTSGKAATAPAVVDVHASSAAMAAAGSVQQQQQQQQQGCGLKHRLSCKAAAGGATSPAVSKQQQQDAATTHSIYKSRPPGSQVGASPANSSLHVCRPCVLFKRSSSLSTYCMQRRRPCGSHVGVSSANGVSMCVDHVPAMFPCAPAAVARVQQAACSASFLACSCSHGICILMLTVSHDRRHSGN
jgi:hypothetical protein